jgi:predicted ATPase
VIAAVQFRNFKALRQAEVRLEPFNLFIGPNGSGKTSLIQALLRLRTLAGLPVAQANEWAAHRADGPEIRFAFAAPYADIAASLGCRSELVCDLLRVAHPPGAEPLWEELRARLRGIRAFLFDHYAMAEPSEAKNGVELASNAGNLAAVLAAHRRSAPASFAALDEDFRRIMPEHAGLDFHEADGRVTLLARLHNGDQPVPAENFSQGTLYLLAILSLSFAPSPPTIVCLEEGDRGVHPRMLREVRDALYRLSYPKDFGLTRAPVQVVTTTHSPYMLDQFREHPEEIVLANKQGAAATFQRLSDRPDVLELMKETHLGDLWYSGILGGVPE